MTKQIQIDVKTLRITESTHNAIFKLVGKLQSQAGVEITADDALSVSLNLKTLTEIVKEKAER